MNTITSLLTSKSIAFLLLLAFTVSTFAQVAPPKAAVRNVTDEYFGQKIVDPYRWMEDSKNPEMVAWMKGQSDYTRAFLDGLPLRSELLKRVNELSDAGVNVFNIQQAGNMYFYYRLAPGENDSKLYMRDGLNVIHRQDR